MERTPATRNSASCCNNTHALVKPKPQISLRAAGFWLCLMLAATSCCHTHSHSAYRSIHQAAVDGDAAGVAAALKMRPGDLNLADDAGQTPLHLAAIHCRTNVVALLLSAGAQVDARAKGEATPLHLAAQAGCLEGVQALLAKGADPNAHDAEGRTPLGRAKQWHQDAVAQLLRERGGVE
jgi:hypothetical protein